MFCELITLTPRPGLLARALADLEALVSGPDLLGCWHTVMGHEPRIFVLRRCGAHSDHEAERRQTVHNTGLMAAADLMRRVDVDVYVTLPCLPDIAVGAFGSVYEFRIYELQPHAALEAAYQGWADVIQVRLNLGPITAVMHSVQGQVPRLVHIYPYRDLAHRLEIREQAIATGVWPRRGGASRNHVMAAEMAVPAAFSPLH